MEKRKKEPNGHSLLAEIKTTPHISVLAVERSPAHAKSC